MARSRSSKNSQEYRRAKRRLTVGAISCWMFRIVANTSFKISVIILALGIIAKTSHNFLREYIPSLFETILKLFNAESENVKHYALAMTFMLGTLCWFFICTATILGTTCLVGFITTFINKEAVLKGYALVVNGMSIMLAALGITVVVKSVIIEKIFMSTANLNSIYLYKQNNKSMLDLVQAEFQCCGVLSYRDYERSPSDWKRNNTLQVPQSCCRPNKFCSSYPKEDNSFIEEACLHRIFQIFPRSAKYMIGNYMLCIVTIHTTLSVFGSIQALLPPF